MKVSRRVAVVSGGGRGIGRAISLALGDTGCDVAVNYNQDAESATETAAAIEAAGHRAVAVQASVDDPAACATMMQYIADELGPPSVLVHNGGIPSQGRSVLDTDVAELERVMKVHAFGGFNLAKACIPHMIGMPRGDIVMVSSIATTTLSAHGSPYNMAKAALEALAMTLAKEVLPHDIHVNVVAPGLVATGMGDVLARVVTGGKAQVASDVDARSPFGHVCRPEEVASVVQFLISDAAAYLTGVRIPVSGGVTDDGHVQMQLQMWAQ